VIEELAEFSLMSLKRVNDSGVVEQGADQIGTGLGADLVLESQ
jgi:hypothetical protein